jgi:hypothetical protein
MCILLRSAYLPEIVMKLKENQYKTFKEEDIGNHHWKRNERKESVLIREIEINSKLPAI